MARGKKKESTLTSEEKLAQALVPVEEQPYRVPGNWCWTRIASLCSLSNGKAFKPTDWGEVGLPIVRIQNLNNPNAEYNLFSGIVEEKFRLRGNELLFAWSGTPGTSFGAHIWWGKEAVLNQHIFRVDFDETHINKIFFKYAINQQLDMLISVAHGGAGLQHVTKGVFESTPIPLPPLAEQQRIVDRIEYLFAKLEEAKEKAQSVLDSFETRKAAILHKAFTGELTAKWRAKHGVGMDSWQSETLQSVCSMKITDGTHKTPTYCDADIGVPFISAKDVTGEAICWDKIKYIVPELHDELYARLAPQIDDILLAKNGTTGVAAIVDVDKVFDLYVTLAVLRPDKSKILPRYLLRIVNSPVCKNQFDEHLTGIGVPNLHLRDIKEVVIQVPSLAEQTAIIQVVDSIMGKEQQAKEAAEAVLEKIDLLKKSILARTFRGKLGTNDSTEESALELLKAIL